MINHHLLETIYMKDSDKTLIDVFLKDYDSVEFSNHIGWPRYLYDKKRVLSIEDSNEFKKALTISS